jgi:MFS family permease
MRAFTVSVAAMFLAAFGFFGAVVFLPRWFQTVAGSSATESGYNLLPLLAGLIFSAIASGQIVARTGRYKILMLGSLVLLVLGLWLLTNLRVDTDRPWLWLWMVVVGIGIGPSFAVFTLVVQNAVNPDRIGVATSSLTFFQQIGGTVGLTIAGTVFASRLTTEIPAQLLTAGVPPAILGQVGPLLADPRADITGTGDLGHRILVLLPADAQAAVAPLIPAIVQAIHAAFSIALSSSFWVGILAAIIAVGAVVFLPEQPMRATFEMGEPAPAEKAMASG